MINDASTVVTGIGDDCAIYKANPEMEQLVSIDTMVEEIAEHSGFADGRAFAKAFRKKYGVRPSDFRKMRKQESEDEKL